MKKLSQSRRIGKYLKRFASEGGNKDATFNQYDVE